jgi:hypothetical protein
MINLFNLLWFVFVLFCSVCIWNVVVAVTSATWWLTFLKRLEVFDLLSFTQIEIIRPEISHLKPFTIFCGHCSLLPLPQGNIPHIRILNRSSKPISVSVNAGHMFFQVLRYIVLSKSISFDTWADWSLRKIGTHLWWYSVRSSLAYRTIVLVTVVWKTSDLSSVKLY